MRTLLLSIGGVVGVVVAFIAWRLWATIAGGYRNYRRLAARIEPVARRLIAGEDPAPADLERFAAARETRKVLYDALERHNKLALFPSTYLTSEAMAEADLIVWLNHPNELGTVPDDIELMATVPTSAPGFGAARYFVFRYRTNPPHWAAKDGWLAGVAGPYPARGPIASSSAPATFSRFEAYESRSPEEHVRAVQASVRPRRVIKPDQQDG
jgi:hypothetical protein